MKLKKLINKTLNEALTATQVEIWFSNNTNLERNAGDDNAYIRIQTNKKTFKLPNFLKEKFDRFFAIGLTSDEKQIEKGVVKVNADLNKKYDLYLTNNENEIYLLNNRNRKISSDYEGNSFKGNSLFEVKRMRKDELVGHYLFQSARVANYTQAIKIIYDSLNISFEGYSRDELIEIIGNGVKHPEKSKVRKRFKEFLENNRDKINSKIFQYFADDSPPQSFLQDLANFINKNRKDVITVPNNLYIFQVPYNTESKLEENFEELNKGITKFDRRMIYFTPEESRMAAFQHIEAIFTGKYPSKFFSESTKNQLKEFTDTEQNVDDLIYIGIKGKIKFNLNVTY